MHYDPVKKTVGRIFSGPVAMRKLFYFSLDMLLLRAWHVRKALKSLARQYPGEANILDAGSGFGQYTWRMSRMNRLWKIKAVDIDPEHIESTREFFRRTGLAGRVNCERLDLTELKETEIFDFILSVDVMEHIERDELVFRNFFRALKPGGSLLISTPSDMGGSDVHGEGETSFIEEHVRNGYGIGDITRKLEGAGFRKIRTAYTYGKPGSVSWLLSMKYPIRMLNLSKLFIIILPLYYMLTFPIAVILNFFDLFLTHKTGTGLLVSAIR
jgi:SAM-dependent methyltransferase